MRVRVRLGGAFWGRELRGPEEEGEEVVVVQPPDAVRARGLEVVCCLQCAEEAHIAREEEQGEGWEGGGGEEGELAEKKEVDEEVQLVA